MKGKEVSKYALNKLQKTAVMGMVAMILLTFAATNIQAVLWQSSNWLVSTVLPAVVVDLTNEERADENKTPLHRNTTLDAAAKLKAQHMAKNHYFAHFAPDGTSPWHWFDEAGYVYAHAGENLAIHFTDSDEVVEAWMDSPTHRANIVDDKFTEIGVGTAKGTFDGYDTVFVVQLFGAPAAVPTAPVARSVVTPEPTPIATAQAAVEPEESVQLASTEPAVSEEITPVPITANVESAESSLVETPDSDSLSTEPESAQTTPTENQITEATLLAEATPVQEPEVTTVPVSPSAADEVVFITRALIATSSGLAAATVVEEPAEPVSFLALVTKPNTVMQIAYVTIVVVVFVMLLVALVDEARHAHPVQAAYSVALLLLMVSLYWLHTSLTEGAIVV